MRTIDKNNNIDRIDNNYVNKLADKAKTPEADRRFDRKEKYREVSGDQNITY